MTNEVKQSLYPALKKHISGLSEKEAVERLLNWVQTALSMNTTIRCGGTILIYYPGHLASAVCFNEQVNGDYIALNGNRFTICDATYIGAPVGMTMPDMDNKGAKVIVLE